MKKYLFLIAAMLNTVVAFAQFSGSGTGTESDPYLIYNENQLAQLGNFLNQEGVYFRLQKDLDMTDWIAENNPGQGWMPVGVSSSPFSGIFDGNNHKISGIFINRSGTDYVGFFGYINSATITNLTVEYSSIKGDENVGGLVGFAGSSTITGCNVVVTANDAITGNSATGGLVGLCSGTNISGSAFVGNIVGAGNVGGVIGYGQGTFTINDVAATGNISGSSSVSGIAGYLKSGAAVTFVKAFSNCKIVNSGDYTGGVVGYCTIGGIASMSNCSHLGDITANNYVGGIVGAIIGISQSRPQYEGYYHSDGTSREWGPSYGNVVQGSEKTTSIENCCAIGNISAKSYCGGLIGKDECSCTYTLTSCSYSNYSSGLLGNSTSETYLFRDGVRITSFTYDRYKYWTPTDKENLTATSLSNSYFSGNIEGTTDVGGLVGSKNSGTLSKCYAYASVVGTTNVGGIIGNARYQSGVYSSTIISSNVAINSMVSGQQNVGRIYGTCEDGVTIGALGSAEGNRALTTTSVMLCGVAQDVADDLSNGSSVGQSMLKLKANYVAWGWNFDDNWNILESECYPYKKYQAAPPVITSSLVSQATEISGNSVDGGVVYLYYRGRDAVETACNGNSWTFATEPLQSGAQVQLYAKAEGLTPSYLTTTTVKYPGSGKEDDPYLIYSAEDLQGASNSGYFKIMNDIDLSAWISENSPTTGWPAIGRNSTVATYINGDGHTVTGLWADTDDSYNGLFSNYSAGYIKNLNVEVAAGRSVKGADYTGILIGRIFNGQIINCSVKGDVEGTLHVGGIAGYAEKSTLTSNQFEGNASTAADNAYIGGIAGQGKEVTMASCLVDGEISAQGSTSYVGGVYGKSEGGTISKSRANSTVTSAGANSMVGGFAGESGDAIDACFSLGNVTASGADSYTGGLVGNLTGTLSNCYSYAKATGTQFTAGLVGYSLGAIDKCFAKGDISGVMYGAGVVGYLDGTAAALTKSVAANNKLDLSAQSSWGCRVIGGFKNGCSEPELGSNLALSTMQVSLNGVSQKKTDDNLEGVAAADADLMKTATYSNLGWDMERTWCIDEGKMYPYLLWEVNVNPVVEITLSSTSLILPVSHEKQLTATVQPLSATNKKLNWSTSNDKVATVTADGLVKAVAVGKATITATATDGSGIAATCAVEVVANQDEAIDALNERVAYAENLYNNSTEGENIGQYAPGARAELLTVIRDVKSRISSTMTSEEIIKCTNDLNDAIALFESKKVTAGEDTDILSYENIIYVDKAETSAGSTVTLSLKMNNSIEVVGFQCDFYAPEGTEISVDGDGFAEISLSTERTTANRTNVFDFATQSDGAIRILASSTKVLPFNGNSGEIATIKLNISSDIADGDYPLILRKVVISDAVGNSYKVDYVKTTLSVSSFTLGDANGNGEVNIADFTAIANYILGREQTNFIPNAADTNQDGEISVSDLSGLVQIILSGESTSNAPAKPAPDAVKSSCFDDIMY